MKVIIHLAHPAHFHLFLQTIIKLKSGGINLLVTYNNKDILEDLIKGSFIASISKPVKTKKRIKGKISLLFQFLKKNIGLFLIVKKFKPDLILGTSIIISLVGKLLRVENVIINEDDFDVIKKTTDLGYPFANNIICPDVCRTYKFSGKSVKYSGYHELAYLHPKYFKPNKDLILDQIDLNEKYFIMRFSKLAAHHDEGKTGITSEIAKKIIDLLTPHGRVYITSERELEPEFEKYRIRIDPINMHHALYYADMYIGDSQTMTAEAAVLGTPALRFNDFVGKLSYLEELEHKYELTYGIKTSEPEKLYKKIQDILYMKNRKEVWLARKEKMLKDKIDVTGFMVWFVENYPESVQIMKKNPEFQEKFK